MFRLHIAIIRLNTEPGVGKSYHKMLYLWFCIQPDDGYVWPKHVADCWLWIKLCWTVSLRSSSFASELKTC
jgi:hypothetical protein